jgi:uncharacterized membrane protein (UPF0127 family)
VSARARVVIAVVVAVVVAGVAVGLWQLRDDDDENQASNGGTAPDPFRLGATTAAPAPFDAFEFARVGLDDRCLEVLVASSTDQRVRGLRSVESLEPYDGMLFVFPRDTNSHFTMRNTLIPLDITFFDAAGFPVGTKQMVPCPADGECPSYPSDEPYRYALEVPAGSGASGSLVSC